MRGLYQGLAIATVCLLLLQLSSLFKPTSKRYGHVDPYQSLQRLKQEARLDSALGGSHVNPSSANTSLTDSPLWLWPQLLVIGFMKSGTSALYYALCEHPSVACAAKVKEPFYLSSEATGEFLTSYSNMMSVQARKTFHLQYLETCFNLSDIQPHQITLEASTTYVHSASALAMISEHLLNAKSIKLLVMVREPVSRAYSQYNHARRRKKTKAATFEEAVMPELTIIQRCHSEDDWLASQRSGGVYNETRPYQGLYACIEAASNLYARQHKAKLPGYLLKSLYLWHLRPWLQRFGQRIRVIVHQQYRKRTVETMDQVQQYLSLPRFDYTQVQETITHEFQEGSQYTQQSGPFIRQLAELFDPHNRLLALETGLDIQWQAQLEAQHYRIPL
eukprot:TRINITY_DN11199_c0_g3_i1.p2 TRINITY_DN11199_c0_g3~~TRINITY_DN11199_c0_g3_i1.p2  ORF type:complete len:390 (+),score=48.62 TRINITY_DN11199_c0_g3_i1:2485-3654(+)